MRAAARGAEPMTDRVSKDPERDGCHRCGAVNCGRLQRSLNGKRESIVEERGCSQREITTLCTEVTTLRKQVAEIRAGQSFAYEVGFDDGRSNNHQNPYGPREKAK